MSEIFAKENILGTSKGNPCAMSTSKFTDILSYLEEVERDDDVKSVSMLLKLLVWASDGILGFLEIVLMLIQTFYVNLLRTLILKL